MRGRSSAKLFTLVVLAATLSACSAEPEFVGAGSGDASTTPESSSAPPATQAAAGATPDLRAADLVEDLDQTVAARARAFPAGNVAKTLSDQGDVGVLEDLGCFAAADGNGPNLATPVDCAQPHLGETFASVPMDDSWPAEYAAYTEGGSARERWLSWADAQCSSMLSRAVGADGAISRALGVDGPVTPVFDGFYGFSLLPREQWDAGTRATHCWVAADGDAPPSGRWVSTLLSDQRPDAISFCDAGGGNSTMIEVRCDRPHWREWAFSVDVLPALGQQFVNSVDPDQPTDAQWVVLDQFCARSFGPLIGSQRADLRMLAMIGGPSWGAGGQYRAWCTISPADPAQEVAGSAIGVGDGQLQFSPYPG